MPVMRYFGFVGSALLLLLFGFNWFLPQPVSEPLHADTDRPVILISSVEKLPERVVIDTSLPTIVPSPTPEFAESLPEVMAADVAPLARPTGLNTNDAASKTKKLAKRRPLSKVAAARPAPSVRGQSSSSYTGPQAPAPVTRMSLLDVIRERFGQGLFKLN